MLTYDQISNTIDFWKTQLIKNGAKKGDKIGIATSYMDKIYLGVIFASFELGLKIVILSKPINDEQANNVKVNAHLPLDILITNKELCTSEFVLNFFKQRSNIVLNTDDIKIDHIYRPVDDLPVPQDVCLLCTSSGSTDNPKLIEHTHNFFYELCSFNWKPLEFTERDRVLHIIALNHGSALGIFFLPSLYKCKNHYFMIDYFISNSSEEENWDLWLDFCHKNKITKVHSPHSIETENMISAIKRSKNGLPNLTIMILSYINPDWISVINEGKLKKIISIFGCSETSGPLLLSCVDKNTKDFDPKKFSKPIEGFYKTEIDQNRELTVNIPIYNKTVKTEDFFEELTDGYRFISKNKLYRIGDIDVNIDDVQRIFQKNCSDTIIDNLFILVDEVYSKLYAITTSKTLIESIDQIRQEIKIFYDSNIILNDCIYVESLEKFITGIKPDREKMLQYIRQMETRR